MSQIVPCGVGWGARYNQDSNSELRTQDSELRTQNSGLRTQDSELRTQDSELRTQDSQGLTQTNKQIMSQSKEDKKKSKQAIGNGKAPEVKNLYLWTDILSRNSKRTASKHLEIFVPLKTLNFHGSCSYAEIGAYAEYIECDASTARLFYPSFCHLKYRSACTAVGTYKNKWKNSTVMDARLKDEGVKHILELSVLTNYFLLKSVAFLNKEFDMQYFMHSVKPMEEVDVTPPYNNDSYFISSEMIFKFTYYCLHGKYSSNISGSELKALCDAASAAASSGMATIIGDEDHINYMDQLGYFALITSSDCDNLCGIKVSSVTLPSFDEKITHSILCNRIRDASSQDETNKNSVQINNLISECFTDRKTEHDLRTSVTALGNAISVSVCVMNWCSSLTSCFFCCALLKTSD